ncbi:unnamed protein product [Staurois parvus]|uniref:Olfactory receptor n=1 Tax=Staurois parvus TaxID=386267 RepID=A0ABN9DB52_9NEOB|nr:unnamed protein product [Staurois parvus]
MDQTNGTLLEHFVLKGFPGNHVLQKIIFVALLVAYLITMAGNLLIIVIVYSDHRLHSPMYLFLVCLSFTDLLMVSFVIPKLLAVLVEEKTISKMGCFIQSYLYYFITTADILILTVMSIDRFVAICYPLRYSYIMRNSICIKLVIGCFITPFLLLLYPTVTIPNFPFCGHVVLDHFFCDSAAMLSLVCVDTRLIKLATIINSVFILIIPLIITSISYIFIVSTVIKMRSTKGHHKTFSTCVSHLTMVCIVFGSAIFIEVRASKCYSVETDKTVNFVSTILGPLLNPFIYTLRNKKVKDCLRDKEKWKELLTH